MAGKSRDTGTSKEDAKQKPGSPLEWAMAALGGVLVLAMIAFLALSALTGSGNLPDIIVEVRSIEPVGGGYAVAFRASNRGDVTAAGVVIEGILDRNGEIAGRAGTTLDYVPEHSHQDGGLFFSVDPADGDLTLRALGYSDP